MKHVIEIGDVVQLNLDADEKYHGLLLTVKCVLYNKIIGELKTPLVTHTLEVINGQYEYIGKSKVHSKTINDQIKIAYIDI